MNKFVFLITAYNEEVGILQTLRTINSQSYTNWRVIIRDDLSTDNTVWAVNLFKAQHRFDDKKIKLVKNKRKFGEVENTLDSLGEIDNDEIVCRVDAGDWLTDNDTLSFLNIIYDKHKDMDVIWTAHRWGYTEKNISKELPLDADVYSYPWVSSHMKTFRRSAFNNIPDSNFRDQSGEYIRIACDQAVFLPLLTSVQKNKRSFGFFPKVCYHYNIDVNDTDRFNSERTKSQFKMAQFIRERGYLES